MNDEELKQLRRSLPQNSMIEIAKKVGCCKATVSNVLRKRCSEQSTYIVPVLQEAANIVKRNNEAIKEVSDVVSRAN